MRGKHDQSVPAENTAREQRARGKPFPKGVSGNPAGRPKGARSRATVLLEAITGDDLQAIVTKVIEKAKAGDLMAAKLIFDRVAPAPKGRTVTLNLPSLADGYARSKAGALASVLDAVAAGEIDPSEAAIIAGLVEKVGDAASNCGGLLPPPPRTKEQREHAKLANTWPALQPWPSDLSDLK